ncbi:MAG: hypothetical protein HXS54_17880, partial [Theionarchaea archaeon]|nr:hypothetical protein [Theionarchaea archaeon]
MNNDYFGFTDTVLELQKDVKGVKETFIFPRINTAEFGNSLQRNLGCLLYGLSEKIPRRISIQTLKGKITVLITENFFLGAVLQKDANLSLVEMMLTRLASTLEDSLEQFKATNMSTLEGKIQERINQLMPHYNPIRTSAVSLVSHEWEVQGEITLTVTPKAEEESLKKKVQTILNEEIPFFCKKQITIEVKSKFSGI